MQDHGFESSADAYRVKLDSFEGPLDLLLHLIRKSEVNIYDIPIALITEQYLGYIKLMEEMNLDVAGEFLVMAATLIHIKSRTLLPRPDPTQDDTDPEEDPREALVRRLLEHEKYKAAADMLHDRETLRGAQFGRPDASVAAAAGEAFEPELEVDLFSLLAAFRGVLERASRRPPMVLPPDQISIEDRIRQLLARLSETEACGFEDLFLDGDGSRAFMIVTFLALLEMIRLKLIRVIPGRELRGDSSVQARAARGCAAADRGSAEFVTAGPLCGTRPRAGTWQAGAEKQGPASEKYVGRVPRSGPGRRTDGRRAEHSHVVRRDGLGRAQGHRGSADLCLTGAGDVEDAVQAAGR